MKLVSISFVFLLAIFLTLANTQITFTQWSPYPNVNNVVCNAPGYQNNPVVVGNGVGGAFSFWIDNRDPESRIYYKLIGKDGEMIENGQPAFVIGSVYFFKVIEDGAGGCIVVWVDETRNPYASIYAQRINANGSWLWEYNGKFVSSFGGEMEDMALVSDGAGGAIIVWPNWWGPPRQDDIYAQRINASGTAMWGSNGVEICTENEGQFEVAAVSDGAGGAIVTWHDFRNYAVTHGDIYAQRVDGSGSVRWTPNGIPICNTVDEEVFPSIVSDGVGGAVIQWSDVIDGGFDIRLQRVNASGVTRWPGNGTVVCSSLPEDPDKVKIVLASAYPRDVIIAWEDTKSGNGDIYAQRVDSTGLAKWTAGGVPVCTWASDQKFPKVIEADWVYGYIFIWTDSRNGMDWDVYGQRIGGDGVPAWTPGGIPIANANYDQGGINPEDGIDIVETRNGAIIVWTDDRNTIYGDVADVYASRINLDGQLGLLRTWMYNQYWDDNFPNKNYGMGFKIPTDAKKMTRNIGMDRYGNTYVAGYGEGNGTKMDYITIKYDNTGTLLWAVRYDGPAHKKDMAYGLSVDQEYGDVYVTGESEGSTTKSDIVTIKYNTDGVQQWIARYDNPTVHKMDVGHAVLLSRYGGHYVWVTGYTDATGTTSNKSDYITIGYDASTGTQLWMKTYNGTGSKVDKAYALCETENGSVAVTGESDGGSATKVDYATISYTGHDGYQEWVQRYNGPTSKKDYAFAISSVGYSWMNQIIVTGGSEGSTKYDYATIAYSVDGEQNWAARYDGAGKKDIAYDMVASVDDIVYVTGASEGGGKYDYGTVAYDVLSGTQQWVNRYSSDGNKSDIARSVSMALDYNYYFGTKLIVTGSTDWGKNRKLQVGITCIDATTGATVWSTHQGSTKDDIGYSCAVRWDEGAFAVASLITPGSKKSILMLGGPIGSASPFPWITTPTIPEAEVADELPVSYRLAQNYPNPFNPITTIEFELPQQSIVSLRVYNMLGQEVAMLLDHEDMDEGTQEVEFNASTLSSGVYFYRLVAEPVTSDDDETSLGTFTQVKKMLMLK